MTRPFYSYVLHCSDGTFYTGHTDDLRHRVAQHQAGKGAAYTRKRLPVRLVWSAEHATREEAQEAEVRIKGWSRKKKEALVEGRWKEVRRLAKRGRGG